MLTTPKEEKYLDAIEKLIKTKIPVETIGGGGREKNEERSSPEKKTPQRQDKGRRSSGKVQAEDCGKRQGARKVKPKEVSEKGGVKGFGDEMPDFLSKF